MKRRSPAGSIIANGLAALAIFFFAFPVYWMVATAFKPSGDIQLPTPKLIPSPLTVQHFIDGFSKHHFWDNARSSIIITCSVVILAMVVAFFAAAALARFRFRGRTTYLLLLLIVQMVPFEAMLIPIFIELNRLGLVYQLTGVIVAYLAFVLPFTIWTLRGFVQTVPRDLEEAALTDGCTRTQAFMRILFPLIAPGLVATAIYAFMQAWNEFIFANVLLTNENATLPVWLASFFSAGGQVDWGGIMAGSTLFALPVIALFMVVQGRITSGLTAGAVKG